MPSSRPRRSFRLGTTGGEVVRNLRAGRGLTIARLALAFAVGLTVGTVVVSETAGIVDRYQAGVERGRFMWRAQSGAATATMAAQRCAAIGSLDGIQAAGAVLSTTSVTPASQPDASYEVQRVTPDYPSLIWPGQDVAGPGGALVGSAMAETLGLVPGGLLAVAPRDDPGRRWLLRVDRVMAPSPRDEGADRRAFVVAPAEGPIATCLVDPEPGGSAAIGSALRAWFPEEANAVVSTYQADADLDRPPDAELAERFGRWAWLAGALALGVATTLVWWARRADAALYRLLGVSRRTLLAMHTWELVVAVLVPAQVGFFVALAVRHADVHGVTARLALLADLGLMAALAVVPLSSLVWLRRRTILDLLRGY